MAANPRELAHAVREAALGFIYPEACQCCGQARATREEGYVCARCCSEIRFIQPPFCDCCGLPFAGDITTPFECANCREVQLHFSHARSVIAAEGLALEIIHRYKYQRALYYEPLLARLLIEVAAPELVRSAWSRIVPVPLHAHKLAEREFNQAEQLGRALSQATGLPLDGSLVRRAEPTRTQTRLTRSERAANVQRAFAPLPGASCAGQRVVLVDDVFTTGATTSACAKVLLEAGASEVCVWTLARGLLH